MSATQSSGRAGNVATREPAAFRLRACSKSSQKSGGKLLSPACLTDNDLILPFGYSRRSFLVCHLL